MTEAVRELLEKSARSIDAVNLLFRDGHFEKALYKNSR